MTPEQFEEIFEKVKNHPKYLETLRRFIKKIAVSGSLTNSGPGSHTAWDKRTVGEEFNFQYGKGLEKSERLEVGPIPVYGSNGIVSYTSQPLTERPSVIVGRKGSAGALNISEGASWTTDVAYYIECPENYDLRFLYILLDSLNLPSFAKGVKPGLSRKDIRGLTINVPPLEEQERIVAKVDELMALCDELEDAQGKTATIQKDFVASSLLKLQTDPARTFEELIEANLNYFSSKTDLLHHTKNELVSLAIQGKFLKGGSTHPTFIPLGELCSKTGSGSTPRGGKSVYQDSGIALLRSQNIYNDGLRLNDVALISEVTHEKMKGTKVYPGDLLLNITGGSIGRCCIVPDDTPEMNVSQHVSIVRPKDKDVAHFLHLVITSPYFQRHIMNEQTGAGREGLPKKKMDLIPIPIFGSSEQQEITEQAHKIVTLCDQLQAKIEKEESIKSDLLKTLVA